MSRDIDPTEAKGEANSPDGCEFCAEHIFGSVSGDVEISGFAMIMDVGCAFNVGDFLHKYLAFP